MSPNTLRTVLALGLVLVLVGGLTTAVATDDPPPLHLALGLVLALGGLIGAIALRVPPQAKDEAPRPPADKGTLQKLLEERLKVAKQEVEARRKEFEAGKTTLEGMAEASRRLFKAELDLATSKAERVAVYERYVKLLKQVSEVNKARYEAGRLSAASYYEAEYLRLDAEIALEREKARK